MSFRDRDFTIPVDRVAVLLGAAGFCLGSFLTYSWVGYSQAAARQQPKRRRTSSGAESEPGTPRGEAESAGGLENPQLLLIVNNELQLSTCKLGEHCAHAAVGQVKKLMSRGSAAVYAWDKAGGSKVCVGVTSENDVLDVREKARQAGLSTFAVTDRSTSNGKTHTTVLAVGPGSQHVMAEVLGQLPGLQ